MLKSWNQLPIIFNLIFLESKTEIQRFSIFTGFWYKIQDLNLELVLIVALQLVFY